MGEHWIVTGANRGLGLEFVRQLRERGQDVTATARTPERADALRALGVRVEPLDVGDAASIACFAATVGDRPVDVLINNAGMGVGGHSFDKEDWDDLARYFEVNAVGAMRLTRGLLPNLRRGHRQLVANVTSRMGSIEDNTSGGAYGYRASKAALNMLTKSMSIDLRSDGITCVVLHPGWVATDMGGAAAPTTAVRSVSGMLDVLDGLKPRDSGRFLDHAGETVPW